MNIDQNAVNHVGGAPSAAPVTPCWSAQDLPGGADEVALLARMRELVRDRAVVVERALA